MSSIPGYSYYVGNAARAARLLKYGGYIGIGFAFAGTTNDVANACTKEREGECGKIAVRDYTKFAVGTGATMYGGAWGGSAAASRATGPGIMKVRRKLYLCKCVSRKKKCTTSG